MTGDPDVRRGAVAPEIETEHPGLWLAWTGVACAPAPTPPELRERLRALADRMTGAGAIALRSREVPHLYRVLFRHLGLDPDVHRPPAEAASLRRMAEGGLRPRGLIEDALTIAALETGVGVTAFDAGRVEGAPALAVRDGALVVADAAGPLAPLFGDPHERAAVSRRTSALVLAAVGAPNVAEVYVEEALWIAWDILNVNPAG